MNKTEFVKITEEYNKETKRWSELKVGQVVYEWGDHLDLFEHEITSIDIDNRVLQTLDRSLQNKESELSYFDTKDELKYIHGITV